VIQASDPLLVSYSYGLNPSIRYSTTWQGVNLGLDFPWVNLAAGHDQSRQTLLSGIDNGFLLETTKDTAQVNFHGTWNAFQAQAGAAYVRYDSRQLAYVQQQYDALLTYRPTPALSISLTADRTVSDYTVPVQRTNFTSTELAVDWYPPGEGWSNWWATAVVDRRVYKDSLAPTQIIDQAILKARLTYGKLDFLTTLTASEQTRGGVRTNNYSFELSAIRRF